jgi:TonB family protein
VRQEPPKPAEPAKSDPNPAVKTDEPGWKPSDKIKVSLKQTTRGSTERTATTTKTTSRTAERAKTIDSAINNIRSGASGSVNVELRGPGGGGIPYAGFNDALVSAYMRAWTIPADAADETSKVVVTITLRRDGTVISSRIQTRSGNSSLDASVQRALDKVTFVGPFPDSVKDAQKTFWLQFDPRARRMMG